MQNMRKAIKVCQKYAEQVTKMRYIADRGEWQRADDRLSKIGDEAMRELAKLGFQFQDWSDVESTIFDLAGR